MSTLNGDLRPDHLLVRRAFSQECPGYLKAAQMASCRSGPAPWDPLPAGFAYGAGPTIVHAQGPVSQREEDIGLVAAAARGDVDEVRKLLPRVSSPNVRTRGAAASSSSNNTRHGHATTALHAASALGSVDVVQALLDARADPRQRQSGLRLLTPLHEAGNVAVANALLAAGASPVSSDPREPEPAWYHRHHGRAEVAAVITAAARAASAARRPRSAPRAQTPNGSTGDSSSQPRRAMPSMSAAEVTAARKAWKTTGEALRAVGTNRIRAGGRAVLKSCFSPVAGTRSAMSNFEDIECAICMQPILGVEECMMLPCNGFDLVAAALTSRRHHRATPADGINHSGTAQQPHAFHVSCLERWWTKSCQCPTCRRDVRQWLKASPTQHTQKKAAPPCPEPLVVGVGGSRAPIPRMSWPASPMRRGPLPRQNF